MALQIHDSLYLAVYEIAPVCCRYRQSRDIQPNVTGMRDSVLRMLAKTFLFTVRLLAHRLMPTTPSFRAADPMQRSTSFDLFQMGDREL